MRLVLFRLAERVLGLEVESVREVQRMVLLRPVIGMPPEVLGVINLHGEIVPVLDLRRRLGMEVRPAHPSSPLLILYSQGHLLALLVDQVQGVVQTQTALAASASWDCTRGLLTLDEQLITVLDADALPPAALKPLLQAQIVS